jgi:hypothetical protein
MDIAHAHLLCWTISVVGCYAVGHGHLVTEDDFSCFSAPLQAACAHRALTSPQQTPGQEAVHGLGWISLECSQHGIPTPHGADFW